LQQLSSLKQSSRFKIVKERGQKWVTKSFLVLALALSHPDIEFGVIASGKLGSAVVRNRARRRLREAIRAVLPLKGQQGFSYVFIARSDVLTCPFEELKKDLTWALERLHQKITGDFHEPS